MTQRPLRRPRFSDARQAGDVFVSIVIFAVAVFVFGCSPSAPEVVDENQDIQSLERQVGELQGEFSEVSKLLRSGDRDAGSRRAKALQKKLETWLNDWEAIFTPKRDADGELPEDLQGYESVPATVATMRLDLLKMTNL